jgi:hypothetical protein
MFRVGEKVVYIKRTYYGLKLNSISTIKEVKDYSISLEDSYIGWWFSKDCFITLTEHRKNKLQKLQNISE